MHELSRHFRFWRQSRLELAPHVKRQLQEAVNPQHELKSQLGRGLGLAFTAAPSKSMRVSLFVSLLTAVASFPTRPPTVAIRPYATTGTRRCRSLEHINTPSPCP